MSAAGENACDLAPGQRCSLCKARKPLGNGHQYGDSATAYLSASGRLLPDEPVAAEFATMGLQVVPESEAIIGWRFWAVRTWMITPWLLAPFRPEVTMPAARWQPGVNEASTVACWANSCRRVEHPSAACWCGIRAMSSLPTLLAFHRSQQHRLGPLEAFVQVELWGNVVGPAPGDDWQRTIRASRARILGPLYVADPARRDALAEHYEVPTLAPSERPEVDQ